MHQSLGRPRHGQVAVARGGHLAQAHADGQDQVGVAHPRGELRVDADTDIAGIERMSVVEGVLEAEAAAHRQLPGFGKALQRARALRASNPSRRQWPAGVGPGPAAPAGRAAHRAPARPVPAPRAAAPQRRSVRSTCPRAAPARPAPDGPASPCGKRARRTRAGGRRAGPRPPTSPCPACPARKPGGNRVPGRPRGRAGRRRPGRPATASASSPGTRCEARSRHCLRLGRGSRGTPQASRRACPAPRP